MLLISLGCLVLVGKLLAGALVRVEGEKRIDKADKNLTPSFLQGKKGNPPTTVPTPRKFVSFKVQGDFEQLWSRAQRELGPPPRMDMIPLKTADGKLVRWIDDPQSKPKENKR